MTLTRVLLSFGLFTSIIFGTSLNVNAQSCLHTNGSAIDMAAYVDSHAHPYAKVKDFDKATAQLILLWQAHGVDALNNSIHKRLLKSCFQSYDDCGFAKEVKPAALARLMPALDNRQPYTSVHLDASPPASAVQWAKEKIGACALTDGGASPSIDSVLANVEDYFGGTAKRRDLDTCTTAAVAILKQGGDTSKILTADHFAKSFLDAKGAAQKQRICDHAHQGWVTWGQDLSKYYVKLEVYEARMAERERARQRAEQQRRNSPPPVAQNTYNSGTTYGSSYNSNSGTSSYIAPPIPQPKFRTCTSTHLGGYGGGTVVTCKDY